VCEIHHPSSDSATATDWQPGAGPNQARRKPFVFRRYGLAQCADFGIMRSQISNGHLTNRRPKRPLLDPYFKISKGQAAIQAARTDTCKSSASSRLRKGMS